jgi:hypothetical protein
LAAIREELADGSASKLPDLFPLSGAERQIEIAFPGGGELRPTSELISGWRVWLN